MKKLLIKGMVLLMLVGCGQTGEGKQFTVGVVQWDNHPALDDSFTGMVKGLEETGIQDKVNVIHKVANGQAPDADQIIAQFVSEGVDLIYAIATPAAQSAMNAVQGTDIKIVFAAITDPIEANLVGADGLSDVITGVSDAAPMESHLKLMKEFLPEMSKVGILYKTSEANSLIQVKQLKAMAPALGLEIEDKGVNEHADIPFAAAQLADTADAFYIITDNLIATAAGLVVDVAAKKDKPVFMAEDGKFDEGIFASDSISYSKMGIQAGHMISKILLKEATVSEIPFEISTETTLIVSQKTADQLGIEIPQSIVERADIR